MKQMVLCSVCQKVCAGVCRSHARQMNPLQPRYKSARWRRLRQIVINRDLGLCVKCNEPGEDVDHIEPAQDKPELFWAMDNLQLLCKRCHTRKTMEERRTSGG